MNEQRHWESVYQTKAADDVSWYKPHLEKSLELIASAAVSHSAAIIDVGGGEATLVDDLLAAGYANVSVLDISQTAIDASRTRLGMAAEKVNWLIGDITRIDLPHHHYDVWHDRAVFHFLTHAEQRDAYVRQVTCAMRPGGHVIVATSGPEGPTVCSGLDIVRYDSEQLHSQFGSRFRLVESTTELHQTPFGTTQQFLYCFCRIE